ncbi:MAG: NMD3-related protein [Candidatus Micrarchaeaceae archaeon]
MKYCPICNASNEELAFVGELCINCFKKLELKKLPEAMKITICKRCGRIKTPQGWKRQNKGAFGDVAAKELKNRNVVAKLKSIDLDAGKAEVEFIVEAENEKVGIEKEVGVELLRTVCDICYKKSAGYYEAIVQLRGGEDSVRKMEEHIGRFLENGDAFIAKREAHGYGVDLYISDRKAIELFMNRNRLHPKRSYTLYGTKNGRKLYRHSYSVQLDRP